MLKRTEESKLTNWYFEIDRRLLWCVLGLIFVGFWAMISAGSVAAERIGMPWFFFIEKALPFYGIGLVTLFASSMLNKKWVLRISALNVIVCLFLLLVTLVAPAATTFCTLSRARQSAYQGYGEVCWFCFGGCIRV